jgi:hypothetical protein
VSNLDLQSLFFVLNAWKVGEVCHLSEVGEEALMERSCMVDVMFGILHHAPTTLEYKLS